MLQHLLKIVVAGHMRNSRTPIFNKHTNSILESSLRNPVPKSPPKLLLQMLLHIHRLHSNPVSPGKERQQQVVH
jgi:hypothetical protein